MQSDLKTDMGFGDRRDSVLLYFVELFWKYFYVFGLSHFCECNMCCYTTSHILGFCLVNGERKRLKML